MVLEYASKFDPNDYRDIEFVYAEKGKLFLKFYFKKINNLLCIIFLH